MPQLVGVCMDDMRGITDTVLIAIKAFIAAPVVVYDDIVPSGIAANVFDHIVKVVGDDVVFDVVVANGQVEMKCLNVVADRIVEDFAMDPSRFGVGVDVKSFGIEAQIVVSDDGVSLSGDEDANAGRSMTAEDMVTLDAGIGRAHRHDTGCVVGEAVTINAAVSAVFDQHPVAALTDGIVG